MPKHGYRVVTCVACGADVRLSWVAMWPVECACGMEYTPAGQPSPEPICPGLAAPDGPCDPPVAP